MKLYFTLENEKMPIDYRRSIISFIKLSLSEYSENEFKKYYNQKDNIIKPYAFSIVDTYGLLDNSSMARYFYLIDNNLDPSIKMGYHEHNNFQLGFSNTIKFLEKSTKRTLVADSTVYGMGKSAGNCASELLAMHLNEGNYILFYTKNNIQVINI